MGGGRRRERFGLARRHKLKTKRSRRLPPPTAASRRPPPLASGSHWNRPKVSEPFSPVPHRHVARGSNVLRNTGRSGPLSSAASHERRVLRLRSVGQAGPDPARVKRPGEGNVSRVESAALEWKCSAIYAVESGFP